MTTRLAVLSRGPRLYSTRRLVEEARLREIDVAVINPMHFSLFVAEQDIGILLTDHNVRETLDICERAYIVSEGLIIAQGQTQDILSNQKVREVYLGEQFKA